MAFSWLRALRHSLASPVDARDTAGRTLRSFDLGYCPGCKRLRVTNSVSCSHCDSTAPVTADA